MKIKKPQKSGYKSSYYNYRLGIYRTKKSVFRFTLPVLVMVVVGFGLITGYSYINKDLVAHNQESEVVQENPQNTIAVQPFKEQPYQLKEDKDLTKNIRNKIDSMPKSTTWSISVRDIKTGRMSNINSYEPVDITGLDSLFILPGLEKRITSDNWKYRLGDATVRDCVVSVIKEYNTKCYKQLSDYVGNVKINGLLAENGFNSVKIDANTHFGSASDLAEMMYRLQTGKILSDKARRAVFDGLYEHNQRSGIASNCRAKCLTANQATESKNFKNDMAIVTRGDKKYVLVVMSSNTSWKQVADMANFIDGEMTH